MRNSLLILLLIALTACAAPTPATAPHKTPGALLTFTESPTVTASIPAGTVEPTPTEGAPATALNVAPEVKAVLDAQKAPYTVNESGEAVITVDGKEIVLNNLADTKTDFGLAEDILNGLDKDTGIRYLFTEKGGWAKVIEAGTPENRTKVNYEDFANGVVNASAALLYQENPTIPAGAIDPQWWLDGNGSKEAGGYLAQVGLIPYDFWNKGEKFTKSTQPYGTKPTLHLEFSKNGIDSVTDVQANKNPTPGNPDQNIFLNLTFDKDRYYDTSENVDNLEDYMENGKVFFRFFLLPDSSGAFTAPSSFINAFTNLRGPDGLFSSLSFQKPGELLGLFTPQEQADVESMWQKRSLVPWGEIPLNEVDIKVSSLPVQLALSPLAAENNNFPWGDIQP